MARVFLSYARDDTARALAIAKALERAGHDVWWDRQIHGGSRFAAEIDQALKNAEAVVVLWSEASIQSAWVQDEAAEGRDAGRLIPVKLDDNKPPLGFRQYQCIDFSGTKGRAGSAASNALLAAISARSKMPPEQVVEPSPVTERRLSAILAAGVVGYSRLMGANEVGTLRSLQTHHSELVEPQIEQHQGRVVKWTGDCLVAEFPSVVNAVQCAVAIQAVMPERNADVPDDRRIDFRIGINLGDVIVDSENIFGDGLNLAQRIESRGRPGGVTVSAAVRDNVGNRLEVQFEDGGQQSLNDIGQPVQIYHVQFDVEPTKAVGTGILQSSTGEQKSSIAVLPFKNMSGDPEQEYFSDGITEDIITDLSKISGLFVVGRTTSFIFKDKSVQLPRVATDLGVKFLLGGSIRKAGRRVRVTAQLMDGQSGGHLWADRYDRELTDVFAIQDEITRAIVEQLKVRLQPGERKALSQAPTANIEAYNYFLKGREFYRNSTKSLLLLARQMFEKAVELDPAFARAHAGIANCASRLNGYYAAGIPPSDILAIADRALSLDSGLAEAHSARAEALGSMGRHGEAVCAFEQALLLDPNSYEANYGYGRYRRSHGDLERAADLMIRAVEVQPDDCQAALLVPSILRSLGRHELADKYARLGLSRAEEQIRIHPEYSRPAQLGAPVIAHLGDRERAKQWLERALAIDSDDNHARYNAACTYAQLGETERALDLLENWSRHMGTDSAVWFRRDPDLDPIRDHPRFQALLKVPDARSPDRDPAS